MLVNFNLHGSHGGSEILIVDVECHQLLEGGLKVRREFAGVVERLPGFRDFVLLHQQPADGEGNLRIIRAEFLQTAAGGQGIGEITLDGIRVGELEVGGFELRPALKQLGQ